jgi:D-glycero-alpha-D-manno-heptose-7-phosphate kinase
MIISRTPFRISFFGGGTDYPAWYKEHGGSVISTSINKYCFVTLRILPPFFDYKFRIRYYQREETQTIEEISHPSVRECLQYMKVKEGLEIVHHADLPAQSGLGSSSTFTVSLLHALYAYRSEMPTKYQLSMDAINIEQNFIKEAVGSQDQTAAAFGGLNKIEFGGVREINVTPLIIPPEKLEDLQDHLLLFFSGFSRNAPEFAKEQISLISKKNKELQKMQELCDQAEKIITSKSSPIQDFGKLLNEQWKLKCKMSTRITNGDIDNIINKGIESGALGGKLLGAGGGGFILFFAKPENHIQIKKQLHSLLHVPFRFEFSGSQIIYFSNHA